jgi:hypothetical protein
MLEGIFGSMQLSAREICVAILVYSCSWFLQIFKQQFPYGLGSLFTIFAHPDECGPVPRTGKNKKQQPGQLELSLGRDKAIEIREIIVESIAYALDAIARNSTHSG